MSFFRPFDTEGMQTAEDPCCIIKGQMECFTHCFMQQNKMFWKDQTWNHIIGLYIAPTGQIDRPLDKKTDGWMDGWAEAQTDRKIDGQLDRQID